MIYTKATEITKSDSVIQHYKAIYVGGAGDIKVDTANGNAVTFKSIPVGTILPVSVRKIYSTGTSATLMVGLK